MTDFLREICFFINMKQNLYREMFWKHGWYHWYDTILMCMYTHCPNVQHLVNWTTNQYSYHIQLFQPDSLELRRHLVMFQSTTLQGQVGLSQKLQYVTLRKFFAKIWMLYKWIGKPVECYTCSNNTTMYIQMPTIHNGPAQHISSATNSLSLWHPTLYDDL